MKIYQKPKESTLNNKLITYDNENSQAPAKNGFVPNENKNLLNSLYPLLYVCIGYSLSNNGTITAVCFVCIHLFLITLKLLIEYNQSRNPSGNS
ncbi:MAG: hypothetical protein WA584_16390 [Pyrinomonadaceae bacterium]